ncbi:ABC transporter substrate-binding protein [Paenibacillus sp. HJGM_3]|uniref:ABC transporter substrate-binding protein n=1 Tax=Paenibacillus sp. HJGM_3 TaxID=3379816 RepID=UPI003858F7FE
MNRARGTRNWEKELRSFPLHPNGIPGSLRRKVEARIAMEEQSHGRRPRLWFAALAAIAVFALLFVQREPLLRWLKQEEPVLTETIDTTTERTLKLLTFHRDTFMRQYGNAFLIKYPNMQIAAVETMSLGLSQQSDLKKAYYDLMEKEQLDVLYVPLSIYKEMAADGKLYPLETFIQKERYDLAAFRPGVIDLLREAGGGKLYGLYPTMYSQAIYYNKDLFDRYGVPLPTDHMSWDDVLRLAARFPADARSDQRVYGFVPTFNDAYNLAQQIALTKRIQLVDAEGKTLLANAPAFRDIWATIGDGLSRGWLNQTQQSLAGLSSNNIEWYKRNEFFLGNAAMLLANEMTVRDLQEAKKRFNLANFTWDLVTEPVDPQHPEDGSSYRVDGVYVVSAKSSNPRDAWELIKLIHSEPIARKNTAAAFGSSTPSSLQRVQTKPEDVRMEAFTALKPKMSALLGPSTLPAAFAQELNGIVNGELKRFAQGTQSMNATIDAIQSKGQEALDRSNWQNKNQ